MNFEEERSEPKSAVIKEATTRPPLWNTPRLKRQGILHSDTTDRLHWVNFNSHFVV